MHLLEYFPCTVIKMSINFLFLSISTPMYDKQTKTHRHQLTSLVSTWKHWTGEYHHLPFLPDTKKSRMSRNLTGFTQWSRSNLNNYPMGEDPRGDSTPFELDWRSGPQAEAPRGDSTPQGSFSLFFDLQLVMGVPRSLCLSIWECTLQVARVKLTKSLLISEN